MEEAVVAGGFPWVYGHGLAVELFDAGMGVGLIGLMARSCYQKF